MEKNKIILLCSYRIGTNFFSDVATAVIFAMKTKAKSAISKLNSFVKSSVENNGYESFDYFFELNKCVVCYILYK